MKDPITGASVIVVERAKLEEIIEKNILDNLQNIITGEYQVLENEEYISKFRLIPFSSLGKQNGMLLGFKPDFIVIGIYEKSITKNQEYTGLVGLDILDERSNLKNEYTRNIKI